MPNDCDIVTMMKKVFGTTFLAIFLHSRATANLQFKKPLGYHSNKGVGRE